MFRTKTRLREKKERVPTGTVEFEQLNVAESCFTSLDCIFDSPLELIV